jgi:hypothetical protein
MASQAVAGTVSNGKLVEDFTSLDSADLSAYGASTSGLWNIIDHVAQAGVVSAGSSSRPIWFGDGSDGALSLTSGSYTFDTDTHPNGYNFTSVSIGAGVTLSVQGSNPLIIRSLSTLSISASLSADGNYVLAAPAANGVANDASLPAGPSGGVGRACAGSGGAGGDNPTTGSANDGQSGLQADGVTAENDQGFAATPLNASTPFTGPGAPANFDTSAFVCGTGGGGGAARTDAGPHWATGGAGGAGGGAVRIISVGDLTVASVSANGGNGGDGANDTVGCSGNGSGGSGGAIWLQSFKTVSVTGALSVNGGTGGSCGGAGAASLSGITRCDSAPASRPVCDVGDQDTDQAAAGSVIYYVQSKAYDLGAYNASFSAPTVTTSAGSGSVQVSYAGSSDGTVFSSFTTDLTSLSNQKYRYIKFKIAFTTGAAAGTPPQVSRIEIPFSDLGPSDVQLSLGCGTTRSKDKPPGGGGPIALFWSAVFLAEYLWMRRGPKIKDWFARRAW